MHSSGSGAAGDPQTLTFDLGTITNNDTDNTEPETLVIRYTVKVANIVENQGNGSAAGSLRDNSAHLEWTANAATSATATVAAGPIEVIEPELQATITASITTGDAFDPITYTITVSHTANSENDAFDVTIDDLIPANINVTSIIATHSTLGDVSASFAMLFSSIYTVSGQAIDLLVGETLTLVIDGTLPADIQPGQSVTNSAIVLWTSLDDNAPLDGDDFDERCGDGITGGLHDYEVTATAASLTVPNATFDKSLVTTGLNSVTNSATEAVIGETVRYRLLVTLPEGTTNLAHILDTLDLGLSFDRIVSVTGYSGGVLSLDVFSSESDLTPTMIGDGLSSPQQLTFHLETLSNLDGDNGQVEQFEIIYDAIVLNSAANQGADSPLLPTTLGNSAHYEWDLFSSTQATASSDANDIEVIEPLLNVTMSLSDSTPNLADVVTFTLTITHTAESDIEAFDIRLLDTLPAGLTLDLGSFNASGASILSDNSSGNMLDIVLDQVPFGATVTVTFNATVTSAIGDIGLTLPNNLDMTWTSLPGTSTAERDGDVPLGIDDYADTDSTSATVVNPELSVTIDDTLAVITTNQTMTYTIIVTNSGTSDATGIIVTSTLPIDRAMFVSTDDAANVTFNSGTGLLTWTPAVGSLAPAGTLTLLLTMQVNPTAPAGADFVTVPVTVAHNNIEPTPANNFASDTDTLDATPDLVLSKSDLVTTVTPGSNSVYTINVSNVGNQDATNVLITETVPTGAAFNGALSNPLWTLTAPNTYQLSLPTFAAGASLSFNFAVTINSPAASGQNDIVNTATITDDGTNGPDPTPADNTGGDTNTLDAAPDYVITIDDGETQVRPGDVLTYQVTVSNQGNQNGTGVVVSDTFPPSILQDVVASGGGVVDSFAGTITWSVGNLPVNGSITFTVTAKVRTVIDPSTKDFTHSTSVTDDLMNGLDPTPSNNLAADIDTLFFYSYDSFHNWREPQFAAFFPQANEVGRPLPPLPVDPIFSGLTEPGTTLVGRIYDSQGRVMGERQVVADSGGNWLMTFPNVLIFEHPHRMEIIVTPAISNSAHENGFNLRRYFHPAIHTELYCNEQMSVSGVFRNRAYNIIDAMHSSNTRPLGFDWFSHAYELNPASTNVANQ